MGFLCGNMDFICQMLMFLAGLLESWRFWADVSNKTVVWKAGNLETWSKMRQHKVWFGPKFLRLRWV